MTNPAFDTRPSSDGLTPTLPLIDGRQWFAGRRGWLALMVRLLSRARRGTLDLTLPDGTRLTLGGQEPGPQAAMTVHRRRLVRRVLIGGHTAFGESFVDGDWDSPDVTQLLLFLQVNEEHLAHDASWVGRVVNLLLHRLRANTKGGSRRNIAFHYDLGNGFYGRWLDETMTYSSAVFTAEDQPLDEAQREKYRRMADLADIQPGDRVLEIGCGWGGFAEYAAAERGAHVTAVTISKEQHAFTVDRLARAGLADRGEVRLQDYRDIDGRFDRIVSIEMIEAVGQAYWRTYFAKVRDLLRSGGQAAVQAITIDDTRFQSYRRQPDFIQRHIFPGGMLLTPQLMWAELRATGLKRLADHGYGLDYARTLAEWRQRFHTAWPDILRTGKRFDDRFRRLWTYYLSYCEAGFRARTIDVRQFSFSR
jgi:cyclopropane-fatty-acyl-phospholipid synthase